MSQLMDLLASKANINININIKKLTAKDLENLKKQNINLYQWLKRPYRLGAHFKKALGSNYFFSLDKEYLDDQGFHRTISHQNKKNNSHEILAWGEVFIPMATYQSYEKNIKNLNNNSIGEALLFNNPEVRRGSFEFKKFLEGPYQGLYCRESVFYWRGLPIYIREIFNHTLPNFNPIFLETNLPRRILEKSLDLIRLMRWHRPIPWLLMLWPTLAGLWLASEGTPSIKLLILFILGVLIMRSCGDVLNDLADQHWDGKVERTRLRPLATGRSNTKEALFLVAGLLIFAFILVLFLNLLCFYLALVGLGLAIVYPFMKRWTYFPQVILGMAYNFGVLMAFAAVQNKIPMIAGYFFWFITVIWTVAYDTFYALADQEDDFKTGIKSTAVLWGDHSLLIIGLLQLSAFVLAMILGLVLKFNFIYFLSLLCALFLGIYQHRLIKNPKENKIKNSLAAFNHNHWIGLIIFLGISAQFYH